MAEKLSFVSTHVHVTPFLKVQLHVDDLKAPVVQRLDNATHRINHSLVDGMIGFVDTQQMDGIMC